MENLEQAVDEIEAALAIDESNVDISFRDSTQTLLEDLKSTLTRVLRTIGFTKPRADGYRNSVVLEEERVEVLETSLLLTLADRDQQVGRMRLRMHRQEHLGEAATIDMGSLAIIEHVTRSARTAATDIFSRVDAIIQYIRNIIRNPPDERPLAFQSNS